jgi:hypothetical protein
MIIFSRLSAQLSKDSLSFSSQAFGEKLFTNDFDKQLNTYNFNTLFKSFWTTEKFFVGVRENYISTIVKSTTQNVTDEQYLWAIGQYNLSDYVKVGLHLNNNLYFDDRDFAINHASVNSASLFLKFIPLKNIEITPYGGLSQNNQIGETNSGFIYGSEVNIDKSSFGDLELSSMMRFQNEDISPRKNTIRLFNVDVKSSFEENLNNIITGSYSEQRKDFYFSADPATAAEFNITNNLQSRTESNYFLQDKILFAPSNSPLSMNLSGRISWRDIDRTTRYISFDNIANTAYDTYIQEFKIDLSSAADYVTDKLRLAFRFSYSERDEKHQAKRSPGTSDILFNQRESLEEQNNNNSQLANISLLSIINNTRSDRLTFSIFHRKLRYDTPSDLNFDDRDELLTLGRVMYEKEFNRFFKIFLNIEGNLNKIVYIYSERSANNNTSRLLKFSSGGTISSGDLVTANSAEISANYTVFDYEELNPNFQSYSFRQLVIRDSTSYKLTKTLELFFSGYLKFSEQGDFEWSSFSGNPIRSLEERLFEPKFLYDYYGLSFGIGFRYFETTAYNISNGIDKIKSSDYTSIGPTEEISYSVSDKINLKVYGWYEFISNETAMHREIANLNLKLSYRF